MSRRLSLAIAAGLALALLLPVGPAAASEVVKLARLVITGKRLSADHREAAPAPKTAPQQLPPVMIEGQSSATQSQPVQLALHPRAVLRAL